MTPMAIVPAKYVSEAVRTEKSEEYVFVEVDKDGMLIRAK